MPHILPLNPDHLQSLPNKVVLAVLDVLILALVYLGIVALLLLLYLLYGEDLNLQSLMVVVGLPSREGHLQSVFYEAIDEPLENLVLIELLTVLQTLLSDLVEALGVETLDTDLT